MLNGITGDISLGGEGSNVDSNILDFTKHNSSLFRQNKHDLSIFYRLETARKSYS